MGQSAENKARAERNRSNQSKLFVPEPQFRPGDTPDYSHISIPTNHSPSRPDPLCDAHDTVEHALKLIRVLRFNGEADGDWKPDLSADQLREGLRHMMRTRAMDERMFTMQRQGKMSFYMKSTGEEAVSVGNFLLIYIVNSNYPIRTIANLSLRLK